MSDSWVELAKRAEQVGCEALLVPDHPGWTAAPIVALAAVAGATSRLRLGTSVLNAGVREPLTIAAEIATLDVISDGRAVLGLGAGHTPTEWTRMGMPYPSPRQRIEHLEVIASAVKRLLAGEVVSMQTANAHLEEAVLEWPRPPRHNVPILIGG